MDELRPPKELEDLWLGPQAKKENIDMIVEQVLQDAGRSRQCYKTADIVCMTVTVLLIPILLLLTSFGAGAGAGPLYVTGKVLMVLVLAGGLWAYRIFYRSLPEGPPPSRAAREHVAWSLEYLDRRERFFRMSDRWMSPCVSLIAIPFAIAAFESEGAARLLNLVWVASLLPAGFVSHWMTNYEIRRIEKIRLRLRGIREDQQNEL